MIIKVSELFQFIKGAVGNFVFFPHPTRPGYLIGRAKRERKAPVKAGEKVNRGKFSDKMRVAKGLMAKPDIAAIYRAVARLLNRDPFRLAVSDALKAPEVTDISLTGYTGKPGEPILIQASDNVDVAEVQVRIVRLTGELVEGGNAARVAPHSGQWAYLAQSEITAGETVTIEATALDLPGNRTARRVDHACGPRVVP